MVLQKDNCSNAHLAATASDALAAVAVYNSQVLSVTNMTEAASLRVCYATRESGGESADDYSVLLASFLQIAPVSFSPMRTISGAAQDFVVSGVSVADSIAWTQDMDCSQTAGQANSTKTQEYVSPSSSSATFALHTSAAAGQWNTCYKLAEGLWTLVTGVELVVFAQPRFGPPIGVAGMPTPIRFFSGVNGDFVVLQPHNCTDAQAVVTSSNSLARSVVTDYRVLTEASMTASGDLRVCYATFESDGDSSDDYVALRANFTQVSFTQVDVADFIPKRTVHGLSLIHI